MRSNAYAVLTTATTATVKDEAALVPPLLHASSVQALQSETDPVAPSPNLEESCVRESHVD